MQTNQKSLKELLTELFDGELTDKHQVQNHSDKKVGLGITSTKLVNYLIEGQLSNFRGFIDVVPEYSGISVCHVDSYGGEDMGTEFWKVWKFTKGEEEIMVKFDGYYQSHYGVDFQEWKFVKPVQVMVTQYQCD